MPSGIGQAIQNAAQDILALTVVIIVGLVAASGLSERARALFIDRIGGDIYRRITRRTARATRVEKAVRAISRGLMLKATIGNWAGSQEQAMEALHTQEDALAGVTVLKAEYPALITHLDEVIKYLGGKRIEVDAVAVSQRLVQPILDATKGDV
jgi:hypothetical protein